jgi:hypothetical protein
MQCLLLPWLMFEFSFNSNAPALGFNIGVRHQWRTPENRSWWKLCRGSSRLARFAVRGYLLETAIENRARIRAVAEQRMKPGHKVGPTPRGKEIYSYFLNFLELSTA